MSVFSSFSTNLNEGSTMANELKNPQLLEEMFLVEECSRMNEEQLKMFLESDLCKSLQEAGKFRKKTIVRLSKQADFDRRVKLAAMALAKEAGDPLFDKLALNRVRERELLGRIMQKYGQRALRIARDSQKDYIKHRMPASFMKAGGELR